MHYIKVLNIEWVECYVSEGFSSQKIFDCATTVTIIFFTLYKKYHILNCGCLKKDAVNGT